MVTAAVGAVGRRGWAASRDWPLITSSGAGGVLAAVRRTSMMKCTNLARGVFLGASGSCVSVSVAVEALGIMVGLDYHFIFKAGREEEHARDEFSHIVGVDGDNHQSRFLG